MNDETVTPLDRITLPWAKEVEVQDIGYDSGLHMLRLRFREGRQRFTTIDLDAATAGQLAKLLAEWAETPRVSTPLPPAGEGGAQP